MSDKKGAHLVDLVSGKRVAITVPACRLVVDRKNVIKRAKTDTDSGTALEITYDNGHYTVRSLAKQELEHVFLNGTRLIGPRQINDGDSLKVGQALLWFVVEG